MGETTKKLERCVGAFHARYDREEHHGILGKIIELNEKRKKLNRKFESEAGYSWYKGETVKNIYYSFMEVLTR